MVRLKPRAPRVRWQISAATLYAVLVCAWIASGAAAADDTPRAAATAVASLDVEKLRETALLGDGRFRHAGDVIHIAIVGDGKRLLTSGKDGAARLWDTESGQEVQRFHTGAGYVWCAQPLPGGKEMLVCGDDKCVTRWDAESGKLLHRYQQNAQVFRLAVSPDGERFAASGSNSRVALWSVQSGELVRSLRGHSEAVYGTAIDSESRFLVSCGDDHAIRVWDMASGKSRHKLGEHTKSVYTVAFAPSGSRFVSCGSDNSIRAWDAESGERAWSLDLPSTVYVVAWSPDGKHIAASCEDCHLYLIDAESGKQSQAIKVPNGYHWPVVFSPDGKSLFSGGDATIWRWEVATGKQVFPNTEEKPLVGGARSMAYTPDGATVYLAGVDKQIHVWNVAEKKRIAVWPVEKAITALDVSPDGRKVLATDDAVIQVFNAVDGKPLAKIQFGQSLSGAGFADRGRRIVAKSNDATASLWDAATGARLATMNGHEKSIDYLSVSRNLDRIVTTASDGTARVWGVHSGKELSRITATTDENSSPRLPTFLADNRSLAIITDANKKYSMQVWMSAALESAASTSDVELHGLIADLGDERYAVREKATRKLVQLATAMRERIDAVEVEDLEVAWRLRQIMVSVERGTPPAPSKGAPLVFDERPTALAAHPDGKHWAAILGGDAAASIVIGEFTPHGPKQMRKLECRHSPSSIAFTDDGRRMIAGNRDGTVSIYE